jgi:hypothetical protein
MYVGIATLSSPVQNVLFAEVQTQNNLTVSCLLKKNGQLVLVNTVGTLSAADVENGKSWAEAMMKVAYEGWYGNPSQ